MDKFRYTYNNESLSDEIAIADLPDSFDINRNDLRRAGTVALGVSGTLALDTARVFAQGQTGEYSLLEICGPAICPIALGASIVLTVILREREREEQDKNE